VFIATQLNSTRRRVELSCVGEVSIATQLNSTDPVTQLNSVQPVSVNNCDKLCIGDDVINKNTTDLLRADWLYAVQLGNWVS